MELNQVMTGLRFASAAKDKISRSLDYVGGFHDIEPKMNVSYYKTRIFKKDFNRMNFAVDNVCSPPCALCPVSSVISHFCCSLALTLNFIALKLCVS